MNILSALDLSLTSNAVVSCTVKMAKAFPGKVWLLHVVSPDWGFGGYSGDPEVMRNEMAEKYHQEHKQLQQYSKELRSQDIDCSALLIQGATIETILNEIDRLSIGMLVLGMQDKNRFQRLLVNSTCEMVRRKAFIPILICKSIELP